MTLSLTGPVSCKACCAWPQLGLDVCTCQPILSSDLFCTVRFYKPIIGSARCPWWLCLCCRYLSSSDVAAVLNASRVGGIFSAEEGACYASTEYLLCGLPVVSTASTGGRHVWYTPQNSVVVEATPAAVATGVCQALLKLRTGEFDRQEIREEAVQMAERFRAVLADAVVCISEERGAC